MQAYGGDSGRSVVSFSAKRTPGFAGESKKALASSIEPKREKNSNCIMIKALILKKQRPFGGCRASDARGGWFPAS